MLQAGHVLSTPFQPFESHVPFLLQVPILRDVLSVVMHHERYPIIQAEASR